MRITRLAFENFRNLENNFIVPHEKLNIIYGNNAQGKTNLLEALWLFTGGHSFRGNKDRELPRLVEGKNEKLANLKAEFYSEGRDQYAILKIDTGRRSSVINGVEKKTGSALVGKVCAVIFSPEHLMLIKEGPSFRRGFTDAAICQIRPSYPALLSKYNRIILQRNTLLRELKNSDELMPTLEIWTQRAIDLGQKIISTRIKYTDKLSAHAKEIYKGISDNKENLSIEYKPLGLDANLYLENPSDNYSKIMKRNENSDIRLGYTQTGPHRDDFDIKINGMKASSYASQGQQRSAVISMKLAEAKVLEENIKEAPIVLLDDVLSELDNYRQAYILNKLGERQVFITCCNPIETLNKESKLFYLENGIIKH